MSTNVPTSTTAPTAAETLAEWLGAHGPAGLDRAATETGTPAGAAGRQGDHLLRLGLLVGPPLAHDPTARQWWGTPAAWARALDHLEQERADREGPDARRRHAAQPRRTIETQDDLDERWSGAVAQAFAAGAQHAPRCRCPKPIVDHLDVDDQEDLPRCVTCGRAARETLVRLDRRITG